MRHRLIHKNGDNHSLVHEPPSNSDLSPLPKPTTLTEPPLIGPSLLLSLGLCQRLWYLRGRESDRAVFNVLATERHLFLLAHPNAGKRPDSSSRHDWLSRDRQPSESHPRGSCDPAHQFHSSRPVSASLVAPVTSTSASSMPETHGGPHDQHGAPPQLNGSIRDADTDLRRHRQYIRRRRAWARQAVATAVVAQEPQHG